MSEQDQQREQARPGAPESPEDGEPPSEGAPERGWVAQLRRIVNVVFPLALGVLLVFSAIPGTKLPAAREGEFGLYDEALRKIHEAHGELSTALKKVSISQRWKMYAPNPAVGHSYMELRGYDHLGNEWVLPESRLADEGWGTVWAWHKSRRDIWQLVVTRRAGKINRSRTWYLRGVCVREARKGRQLTSVQMKRVYRRIRSPERIMKGAKPLGPKKVKQAQDGSCGVDIIRKMIAADQARLGRGSGEGGGE